MNSSSGEKYKYIFIDPNIFGKFCSVWHRIARPGVVCNNVTSSNGTAAFALRCSDLLSRAAACLAVLA